MLSNFISIGIYEYEHVPIISMEVTGKQVSNINEFTIRQKFKSNDITLIRFSFLIPNDNKAIHHNLKFRVGEEIIIPIIERKKESKKIVNEELEQGKVVIMYQKT